MKLVQDNLPSSFVDDRCAHCSQECHISLMVMLGSKGLLLLKGPQHCM